MSIISYNILSKCYIFCLFAFIVTNISWSESVIANNSYGNKILLTKISAKDDINLVGITSDDRVIIARGKGLDTMPWLQWISLQEKSVPKKIVLKTEAYNKTTPSFGCVNNIGNIFAFEYRWGIGYSYVDKLPLANMLTPSTKKYTESDFLTRIKCIGSTKITALSIRDWRYLYVFDINNKNPEVYKINDYFINDHEWLKEDGYILSLGKRSKNIISLRRADGSFGVDPVKSAWINLFLYDFNTNELSRLTNGEWFDFYPKVSPNRRYVAFLRAKLPKNRMAEDIYGERINLSDLKSTLVILDLNTKRIIHTSAENAVRGMYDFLWKNNSTLSYIGDNAGVNKVINYDLIKKKKEAYYSTTNQLLSFLWNKRNSLIVSEKNMKDEIFILLYQGNN